MKKQDQKIRPARRISSGNVLVEAPVLLLHWKLQQPSFFKLKKNAQRSESDWEYLSNPEGFELTDEQACFVSKYYPKYAERDPFSVLNWLYKKSTEYRKTQSL